MLVKCNKCRQELKEQGGLIFGPPANMFGDVCKFHVCKGCYEKLLDWLQPQGGLNDVY
jgi:hypothetical protein